MGNWGIGGERSRVRSRALYHSSLRSTLLCPCRRAAQTARLPRDGKGEQKWGPSPIGRAPGDGIDSPVSILTSILAHMCYFCQVRLWAYRPAGCRLQVESYRLQAEGLPDAGDAREAVDVARAVIRKTEQRIARGGVMLRLAPIAHRARVRGGRRDGRQDQVPMVDGLGAKLPTAPRPDPLRRVLFATP
jgi:hypothetical protein